MYHTRKFIREAIYASTDEVNYKHYLEESQQSR